MNYKHACVVDANGLYVTLVLVITEPSENGDERPTIQHYMFKEGETLIDTDPPTPRPHAGAVGLINPRWDGIAWVESANFEDIAEWETAHPAPEPSPPTIEQQLSEAQAQLSQADTAIIELYEQDLAMQSQNDAAIIEVYEFVLSQLEGGV